MSFSPASQAVYSLSAMEAKGLGSSVIESEHLWLGLLKAEDVLALDTSDFLNLSPDEVKSVKDEIFALVKRFREVPLDCARARRRLRRLVKETQQNEGVFSGHRSPHCREAFDQAVSIASGQGFHEVRAAHLAQAVLLQGPPPLETLFSEYGISTGRLLDVLGLGMVVSEAGQPLPDAHVRESKTGAANTSKTPLLDAFGRELVGLAREGRIDPVIGRSEEIRKVARILVQKRKNNPVLVGEAGVGKTCVVEGLALRCADPKAPPFLKNLRIYEIAMGALIAGTKYRGEFEERLETLVKECSSDRNIVIFIDEVHTMVGAGATSEGAMNAANILKPALARSLIRCIGATTTAEYRKHIEKDRALERRFQVVWVDEPTRDEAVAILQGLEPTFEAHHGVAVTDEAIRAAVDLSVRYLADFRLPDKAMDLIDQACAQTVLKSLAFAGSTGSGLRPGIGAQEVAKAVSERTRIPVESLTVDEGKRILGMEAALKERVMGQDEAVWEVSEAVCAAKAGLSDPRRPVGVFLFLGSTGTGKTELAKALAQFLFQDENKLVRIDMSEYQEKHSVAKLLGAPPGYLGYDEEGQLSSALRDNPYSVILFDEIEKAHPDIFDIFLQIFDEGTLTDARGRKVNFRESIIILTSNLGVGAVRKGAKTIGFDVGIAERPEERHGPSTGRICGDRTCIGGAAGFGTALASQWGAYRSDILDEVSRVLRPQLLNRIRNKIIFYPLSKDAVKSIIGKIMAGINERLAPKDITVRLKEDVQDFLMAEGYSEKDGARKMERVIERHIVRPLSTEILAGRAHPGDIVEVGLSDSADGLSLRCIEASRPL